jgi:multidrug efflux system membrane fusion protein
VKIMRSRRVLVPLLPILLAVACSSKTDGETRARGESREGSSQARSVEFPVEVEKVIARPVEYTVSAVGSVEAFERVEVTSRVPGAVEKVHFAEGSLVDPGTVLVEIEPERYRLAVRSALAAVEKQQAAHAEGQAGLARRVAVNEKNPDLVKEEDLDTWRTRVRTAAAEVAQAKSTLDLAQLNLREAYVRAPVPGLIQTRNVQTGQYVQPGAILATLVRREPLLLRFQVPAQEAAGLKPGMPARFRVGEAAEQYSAQITHVAAAADQSSRMVALTAHVTDPKRGSLRPGAFAQVTVPVGGAGNAPVIPETAVRPSEKGFLGFVVEAGVARERVLTLGLRTADGRVEVRSGIRPGEMLVVRGAEALRDGAAVKVSGTPSGPRPASASPAAGSGS